MPVSDYEYRDLVALGLVQWEVVDGAGWLSLAALQAAEEQSEPVITLPDDSPFEPDFLASDGTALWIDIEDDVLRSRCKALLADTDHYDRVVREASVILESRVRAAARLDKTTIGVDLMAQAFRPDGGRLHLSDVRSEQLGAMEMFKGLMGFFRNDAGHHVVESWTLDDAVRFVGCVDLLLKLVARAAYVGPASS